jgi:hypothetical protein
MWKVLTLLLFRLHDTWLNGEQCRAISAGTTKRKSMMSEFLPTFFLRSWDRASLINSSKTNKTQRYTMVFIIINSIHVSGGSSAHHQEHKTVYTASGICRAFSASSHVLTQAERSRKSSTNTRSCVYSFELLMMGGGTAWNMWRIYSNKYHCVTLLLVGCTWMSLPTVCL